MFIFCMEVTDSVIRSMNSTTTLASLSVRLRKMSMPVLRPKMMFASTDSQDATVRRGAIAAEAIVDTGKVLTSLPSWWFPEFYFISIWV